MKKMITGLSLLLAFTAWGQKKSGNTQNLTLYTYQTFACDNKGYFDPAQYKKSEIDDTYKLLYKFSGLYFDSPTVFKLSSLDDIRKNKNMYLQKLEQQYQEKKKELYGLKVIDLPVWKNLHQEAMQTFENEYQLTKEDIIAFSDPSSLKNSKFYNTCKQHIDAITASDKQKMYTAWKNHAEASSRKNSNPAAVMANFNAKFNDPQKDDYALIDLVGISFHNCANNSFRPEVDDEGTIYKTFDKIFTKLKMDCEEP
ncbi:MAG: hypothetical protein LBE92_12425 [Chryseobacterium sp.]|jgi:hypothetical protein|uniref:hypothetical protein n=1 Tax=Chryseobacterium sp. TaxID=1871047 RepID=UPI00282DABBE|nr:hypothetical protein [Chryseobacterium sp.]MDR2236918.1 hypothetical protein [Chryseobacterium sp.]